MTDLKKKLDENININFADKNLNAADLLALPPESFTDEDLEVPLEFLAHCHITTTQVHAMHQLQLANREDTFLPLSMQCYLEQLAVSAKVALQPLLDWWEIDYTFKKPAAAFAWAELAKALGIEADKAELYGRIGLAQQTDPNGWKMCAAKYANGLDEQAALQACNAALQQFELSYVDSETHTLCQLKSAISQVYDEAADLIT